MIKFSNCGLSFRGSLLAHLSTPNSKDYYSPHLPTVSEKFRYQLLAGFCNQFVDRKIGDYNPRYQSSKCMNYLVVSFLPHACQLACAAHTDCESETHAQCKHSQIKGKGERERYPSRGDDRSRGSENRLVLDEGRRRGSRVKPSVKRRT